MGWKWDAGWLDPPPPPRSGSGLPSGSSDAVAGVHARLVIHLHIAFSFQTILERQTKTTRYNGRPASFASAFLWRPQSLSGPSLASMKHRGSPLYDGGFRGPTDCVAIALVIRISWRCWLGSAVSLGQVMHNILATFSTSFRVKLKPISGPTNLTQTLFQN